MEDGDPFQQWQEQLEEQYSLFEGLRHEYSLPNFRSAWYGQVEFAA
ncbi:hypothetical protein EBME_0119 [bacterium endosymbiont of Mortierella elongata FMR23-6]|nr:hypothetical protein EBME_0119 [bacterium endosymbiont of Mortierella elongata FMR23-6]